MMDNSKRLTPVPPTAEDLSDPLEDDGLSLEELSQSYQRLLMHGDNTSSSEATRDAVADDGQPGHASEDPAVFDPLEEPQNDAESCPVTPPAIVEAVLFVGRPDGAAISAAEIAALMRGVHEAEVVEHIAQLNAIYEQTGRATRIVVHASGYRLQLADDLQLIRDRFYGRVRQVKLNQSAIDCLALIAYQPGISREKLEEQRGQPSGGILNQLVRRQLIEIHREPAVEVSAAQTSDGKKAAAKKWVQRYYPTDRLFELAGIDSLEDLPQTEDF